MYLVGRSAAVLATALAVARASESETESFGICYYVEDLDGLSSKHKFYICDETDPDDAVRLYTAYDTDATRFGASYDDGACGVATAAAAAECLRSRCGALHSDAVDGSVDPAALPGGFFADARSMCSTPAPASHETEVKVDLWHLTDKRIVALSITLFFAFCVFCLSFYLYTVKRHLACPLAWICRRRDFAHDPRPPDKPAAVWVDPELDGAAALASKLEFKAIVPATTPATRGRLSRILAAPASMADASSRRASGEDASSIFRRYSSTSESGTTTPS